MSNIQGVDKHNKGVKYNWCVLAVPCPLTPPSGLSVFCFVFFLTWVKKRLHARPGVLQQSVCPSHAVFQMHGHCCACLLGVACRHGDNTWYLLTWSAGHKMRNGQTDDGKWSDLGRLWEPSVGVSNCGGNFSKHV